MGAGLARAFLVKEEAQNSKQNAGGLCKAQAQNQHTVISIHEEVIWPSPNSEGGEYVLPVTRPWKGRRYGEG